MARCLEQIIRLMNQPKDQVVSAHFQRLQTTQKPTFPATALPVYGPAPFDSPLTVKDLDIFTQEMDSGIALRSLAPAFHDRESTDLIAEDNEETPVSVRISPSVMIPEGAFFTVLNPMLEVFDGRVGLNVGKGQIIAHGNDQIPACFSAEYFCKIARNLLKGGNPAKGLEAGQRGLGRNQGHVGLLLITAECYLAMGLFHLAYELLVQAVRVSPDQTDIKIVLAESLVALDRLEEAETLLQVLASTHANAIQLSAIKKSISEKRVFQRMKSRPSLEGAKQSRLKELVLVEWPRLVSSEKIKKLMEGYGVPVEKVSLKGRTAILYYDSVETRERARKRLMELEDCEFMLANEPIRARI